MVFKRSDSIINSVDLIKVRHRNAIHRKCAQSKSFLMGHLGRFCGTIHSRPLHRFHSSTACRVAVRLGNATHTLGPQEFATGKSGNSPGTSGNPGPELRELTKEVEQWRCSEYRAGWNGVQGVAGSNPALKYFLRSPSRLSEEQALQRLPLWGCLGRDGDPLNSLQGVARFESCCDSAAIPSRSSGSESQHRCSETHASRNANAFFTNASWYWKTPPCPASS